MRELTDYTQIARGVDAIKKAYTRTYTNLFKAPRDFEGELIAKACYCVEGEASFFILVPMHNAFYNMFFTTGDLNALENDLSAIKTELAAKKKPVTCELIGALDAVQTMSARFMNQGFALRKVLRRVLDTRPRFEADGFADTPGIRVEDALLSDIPEIEGIMRAHFDLYSERIPERAEWEYAIQNRFVRIIRMDGRIAALIYREIIHNRSVHSRFSIVLEEYRDLMLGMYIHKDWGDTRYEHITKGYHWIDVKNQIMARQNRYTGTRFDDLYDYIMFQDVRGEHSDA